MSDENTDTSNNGGGGNGDDKSMVPSARLREETALKRRALARIGELEQERDELAKRVASSDTLARQLEEVKAAHKRDLADWGVEKSLIDAGLTDQEGRDIAKYLHGKIPEAGRPSMADWLAAQRSDPSKASRSLQPFLPRSQDEGEGEGEGETTTATKAATTTTRQPPPKTTKASDANSAGAAKSEPMSADKLKEIRLEAQRTNDWSAWRSATGQTKEAAK